MRVNWIRQHGLCSSLLNTGNLPAELPADELQSLCDAPRCAGRPHHASRARGADVGDARAGRGRRAARLPQAGMAGARELKFRSFQPRNHTEKHGQNRRSEILLFVGGRFASCRLCVSVGFRGQSFLGFCYADRTSSAKRVRDIPARKQDADFLPFTSNF